MNDPSSMTRADLAQAMRSMESSPRATEEIRHLLRELQRHQLELEMQNRELQEAQQALEESRNRYMELYDFAPMACVSLDERACIQDLNLTGAALLGKDRSYLQGLPFTPFVDPSDVSRFFLHLRQCIAGQTSSTELRLRINGTRLDVRLHSAPIQDGDTRRRVCRTAILDITELRQMHLRLSLAERLATVGTIAAGIAHEINNPLAFLMGNLGLATRAVQAQRPTPEQQASGAPPESHASAEALKALDEAQAGAERIQHIVKDLVTFARPSQAQTLRVNVQQVLELSLKMAMVEIRHRAQIVRDYTEVPEVVADSDRLGQVFLNLLVNAAQAIPEGAAHRNEIRLRLRASEQEVLVQIQDTGEGIRPDVLERVFDPFFSTKQVGQGMGLGLAISHSLVVQMGGTITVESHPGQGSTFSLRLPAVPASQTVPAPQTVPVAPPPPEVPSPSLRHGRILIVDDEPRFGQTLRMTLMPEHEVTYTASAAQALEWIAKGAHYDAILCDLMMPDVTGRQFYETLCNHSPELARRIIFMTGGAYTPTSMDFVARMTNPLISKPFKPAELDKLLAPLLPSA